MLKRLGYIVAVILLSGVTGAQDQPPSVSGSGAATASSAGAVETIVFLRHGEKPAGGLGQLTPQGLNRALALSQVLPQKFGTPDYLFAPDPRQKVNDRGGLSCYVRPLATIEPTAIRLGMPVQTPCGFRDTDELIDDLCQPQYQHATIFLAWAHGYARKAAADLYKKFGGDPSKVPPWPDGDYDSLYVIAIHHSGSGTDTATFTHDHEGLDGQSMSMPVPAKH